MIHYVLTRYNIGLYSQSPPYPQAGSADAWMEDRLPLFHRTAESIKRQESQAFEWLVIVDPNTPSGFCKPIQKELPKNGRMVFATDLFLSDLDFRWPDTGTLVTSRVDNDDVLLPGYVKTVQASAGERTEVIDTLGYVRDLETNRRYVPSWDGRKPSMFLTYVETRPPFASVCAFRHTHPPRPVRLILERLWEVTLHENNLQNHKNN